MNCDEQAAIDHERAMLMALLLDMPLGPPHRIEGLNQFSTEEKLFSLTACCATMIVTAIRTLAPNREAALDGLDKLVVDMRRQIGGDKQCSA
ncbi:hypothetical protein [Bradyrhizobium elkanii]|uniref:hypothetical protein n=1 Tax=Bradyrhizobium elkanii TaxID=29448 RepID=UPI0003F53A59|nr:hypothetical protein [Bradyrhizobium elkanii]